MKKKSKALRGMACALCAALTLNSAPAASMTGLAAAQDDYYLRGDVHGNDGVTTLDAQKIQIHLLQLERLEGVNLLSADANADGAVNMADAVSVMKWIIASDKKNHVGEYAEIETHSGFVSLPSEGELNSVSAEKDSSGNPCVKFSGVKGSSFTVKIDAEADSHYKLRTSYSNTTAADYDMQIIVNNGGVYTPLSFEPTGDSGQSQEAIAIVELKKGENTVTFVSASDSGSLDISRIDSYRTVNALDPTFELEKMPDITTTTTTVTTTATTTTTTTTTTPPAPSIPRYYAVEADYYDSWEENTNAGFAGSGYVNYNNAVGSYVNWTVEVPADGNYLVNFRYANGTADNRPIRINVNGAKECCYMDFNGTGAWTDWAENSIVLALKSGKNTIRATATTSGGGPNMDYIELEKTDAPAAPLVTPAEGKTVEKLNRGVSAAYTGSGVFVSWRILATDSENTTFKLFKNGQQPPIYEGTIKDASCYLDKSGTASDWYTIDTFVGDECTEYAELSVNLPNKNSGQSGAYFDIPLNTPKGVTTPDGTTCEYTANDCSVGDVDGDGQYEIFVKWDPSNSQDNANPGYTGNVYIDCYTLGGKQLWRVDLGKNIRAGAHYTQFMVYDFDGDGKAEMICKTADGTVDGSGKVIGDASKDYRKAGQDAGKRGDPTGKILSGPEYLTLFDGATGKALDTIDYKPGRGNDEAWGDQYGNRVDRFTACVAYLDGNRASAVFGRGYYTRSALTAYNVENGKLKEVWAYDTGDNKATAGYGDGNHHIMGADVDGDGKDEVVLGSAVVDDNGKLLYTSGHAHGDAMHIGDFDPSNPGIEIFQCLEDGTHPNGTAINYGTVLRDGKTGKILFREEAGGDTGRCIADNLVAGNDGAEIVGSHNSVVYKASGNHEKVCDWADITKWGQNSVVYWSDVLERAVLDRTMADQYGKGRVFTGDGVTYNNYSKSNACLTADLFGDWREEMIFRKSDGTGLRVFATTFTTEYPIYSLMHNPQYRVQVAAQNNGYNQPPHTDYFLGTGYDLPVPPEVHTPQ